MSIDFFMTAHRFYGFDAQTPQFWQKRRRSRTRLSVIIYIFLDYSSKFLNYEKLILLLMGNVLVFENASVASINM